MKDEKSLLCPNCKTGQDTYLLDDKNPFCPYLGSHTGNACAMFVPLAEDGENET